MVLFYVPLLFFIPSAPGSDFLGFPSGRKWEINGYRRYLQSVCIPICQWEISQSYKTWSVKRNYPPRYKSISKCLAAIANDVHAQG